MPDHSKFTEQFNLVDDEQQLTIQVTKKIDKDTMDSTKK